MQDFLLNIYMYICFPLGCLVAIYGVFWGEGCIKTEPNKEYSLFKMIVEIAIRLILIPFIGMVAGALLPFAVFYLYKNRNNNS